MTPLQSRMRLARALFKGPDIPGSIPEKFLYSRDGAVRGVSSTEQDATVVDATLVLALALTLDPNVLSLNPTRRCTVIFPPTHTLIFQERTRILCEMAMKTCIDKEGRRKRLKSLLGQLEHVNRPWILPVEPPAWVVVGFTSQSALLPDWMKAKIVPC